ncbi:GDSL esterase/lipase At1g29670-like [Cynara cardunculus var. scolymus]|uniref:GDSL esterase/lipase At1g29670-like n=1 Tax=Cynara cardunculus var. scolymus TaxID=59895 RepID=UPI000D625CAA|nr:GDSL esterase/lipase At1g29670-like [Cynara cardunculus var. scolymus]
MDGEYIESNKSIVSLILGQLLGFPNFIPPYATVTDQEISTGVNYGSGGAGIREESGSHLGDRISMDKQLLNHKATISRLSALQSNKTFTHEYLKRCIYLSYIGSSDYINNYLMPNIYPTSNMYTIDKYATVLGKQYYQQLRTLYSMGARKVAVFGLDQITRSAPVDTSRFGSNKIVVSDIDLINITIIKQISDTLSNAIDRLNNDNTDARFTFINLASISAPQGVLSLPNIPCCPVRADGGCIPNSIHCPDRDASVLFDRFHPTDITNTVLAKRAYNALSPMDAFPYDISHLAQL